MAALLTLCLLLLNCIGGIKMNMASSKQQVSTIFEILGYSPSCVASTMASCEAFAKPDCSHHVQLLQPELMRLIRELKCETNDVTNESSSVNISDALSEIFSLLRQLRSEKNSLDNYLKNILQSCTDIQKFQQQIPFTERRFPSTDSLVLKELKFHLKKLKFNNENNSKEDTNFKVLNELEVEEWNCSDKVSNVTNCAEDALPHGVVTVYPYAENDCKAVEVTCDQKTDRGGWTVIQNRDSEVKRQLFNRPWKDYVRGFGDLNGEFWLGLDNINALVSSTAMELRVDLEDYDGWTRFANYKIFFVGDSSTQYKLSIGNYSGDAGDSMTYNNGMKFSTFDQDNDNWEDDNCSLNRAGGGWWYNICTLANLNGYQHSGMYSTISKEGIEWGAGFCGDFYSLKRTTMKVRPLYYNKQN